MTDSVESRAIIGKYYQPGSLSHEVLVAHGEAVADKARAIALSMPAHAPDVDFIVEAALLHDIGMFLTRAPGLGCHGDRDYICHGYLGRELLEKEGLPRHALVCERHVGVGLTADEIVKHNLPVPRREMLPISLEEKIICYADKFFSKSRGALRREKTVEEVRAEISRYGPEQLERFEALHQLFSR